MITDNKREKKRIQERKKNERTKNLDLKVRSMFMCLAKQTNEWKKELKNSN